MSDLTDRIREVADFYAESPNAGGDFNVGRNGRLITVTAEELRWLADQFDELEREIVRIAEATADNGGELWVGGPGEHITERGWPIFGDAYKRAWNE